MYLRVVNLCFNKSFSILVFCLIVLLFADGGGTFASPMWQTPSNSSKNLSASTAALPPPANRFALIIGVEDYSPTEFSRLEGSNNDAKSLRNSLIQFAGFPDENVILLASDQ